MFLMKSILNFKFVCFSDWIRSTCHMAALYRQDFLLVLGPIFIIYDVYEFASSAYFQDNLNQ